MEDNRLPDEKPALTEEERRHKKCAIEAFLFTTGEAIRDTRLAEVLSLEVGDVRELMNELIDKYESGDHGIHIIRLDRSYQLCTKKEYYDDLIRLVVSPKRPTLTDVVLETLSIIAYKQPVTKAEIERIRGVNSDHAVNRLVEFGLVRELGRLNAPGRPILFGTTEEFLRSFGVENTGQLPQIDTVKVADFEAEVEEEIRTES